MENAERAAFLRAVCETPADDTVRLVFADWLDENDRGVRDLGLWAWFVRWQIRGDGAGDDPLGIPYNLGWFVDKRHLWSGDLSRIIYSADGNLKQGDKGYGSYEWNCEKDRTVWTKANVVRLVYTRGFVSLIELPCAAFLEHAAVIFAAHPVVSVRLTDKEPDPSAPGVWWYDASPGDGAEYINEPSYLPPALADDHAWDLKTVAEANDWLSRRCVAYGRKLAGLSPLPESG